MEVTQQVKEFVSALRSKLEETVMSGGYGHGGETRRDMLDMFNRALVETLLNGSEAPKPLTRGQKAARTRAANKQNKAGVPAEVADGQ